MAKNPVTSQGMFVNEFGAAEYELNGVHSTREDFNAVTLTRIASALEAQLLLMQDSDDDSDDDDGEEGEGGEESPKPPKAKADNLFGL